MKHDIQQLLQDLEHDAITALDNGAFHQWSQNEIDALHLALACERPLLVRGEPGTGKTQLARAAAVALDWHLHPVTVSPRCEASDLFHGFDAVRRLADAQAAGFAGGGIRDDVHYWLPGPFWRAFDWAGAQAYGPLAASQQAEAQPAPAGHVILIDEIDKADSDLPNSLLEVLGSREFPNPVTRAAIRPTHGLPLVLITTNEERELPAAFLRRCVVLTLEPEEPYPRFLVKRGQAHFGARAERPANDCLGDEVLQTAAVQLAEDRRHAVAAGVPPPGLAEYIDLLAALRRLAPGNEKAQMQWLDRLARYVFRKNIVEDSPQLSQQPPATAKGDPAGS
ncbi:AAA family ATPase [Candidatus Accumulibacter phosphatis]|uniref:ATPase n=1 Tax=Candidatus Accumulibacter phosphatis TaxID=327160 RepID=A0A5S4F4M8_9PROT|nr:MoxR family ATPase [Candidatus Accumulibacter phosphatis]TMQ75703.1 ATPase [Candidatus Accumulibacter phosphatis]